MSERAENSGRRGAGLAVDAWEAFFRAQSVLFRRFSDAPVWQGRTINEYDALYQLSRAGDAGVRQRDLMGYLMISQPSLSRLIDRLVADGLVSRCPDPKDGRGALLALTAEGRDLQRRIGAGHARDVAETLTSRLDEDELRVLRDLARKLVAEDCAGAGPEEPAPER